jgi:PLD-like domain
MFVFLVFLLPAITGISAVGQSSFAVCVPTIHAVVLYAPASNLERSEIETLRTAKVSVDVAMYSFTDRELAAELVRLARSGVRCVSTVIRENQSRRASAAIPLRQRCWRVGSRSGLKASRDLMHFKSYVIDGLYCVQGRPTGRRLASSARTMMCITKSIRQWQRCSRLVLKPCGIAPRIKRRRPPQ